MLAQLSALYFINPSLPAQRAKHKLKKTHASDKTWYAGEGNGKHHSTFLPQEPHERQKKMTQEDVSSRLEDVQFATGKEQRNSSKRMKKQSQSKNNTQLWMWQVMEVKFDAEKNNIA